MGQYQVKMTDHATEQMVEAVSYISKMLLVPDVALRWSERIQAEIASLSKMPGRYPLTPEEPWRSEGVHKMPVENFLVYYWINETERIVWVTAIVYGRRDQLNMLRNMPIK